MATIHHKAKKTKSKANSKAKKNTHQELSKEEILNDYKIGWLSRHISLIGRKEVLTGKAKFGIFGDGKELPQIILSKFFENGDFRSGYYRDQTWMLAAGIVTPQELFAQLYANPSLKEEPSSGGRQMNAHFATRSIDENGDWKSLTSQKNSSADLSSTAAQMVRAVGLALASKKYREISALSNLTDFSVKGREIAFSSIGDASTSEGVFWEAINAAGVMKIPLAVNIWDDGYGISVPTKYQTTKENIFEALQGFKEDESGNGYQMCQANAWDYEALYAMYKEAVPIIRETHQPCIFHIQEVTQPQGHSTSGSHERYKDKKRLDWEKEFDCLVKMKAWIIDSGIATVETLNEIEEETKQEAKSAQQSAWRSFQDGIKNEIESLFDIYSQIKTEIEQSKLMDDSRKELAAERFPFRKDLIKNAKDAIFKLRIFPTFAGKKRLINWIKNKEQIHQELYSSHLFSQSDDNVFNVPQIAPIYKADSKTVNGYQLLNACFDAAFARDPRVMAFGEDLGYIGDVNQGFSGLQEKYGEERIFDTGIREATIIGQGIGLAQRGLRPIAEIQYLDYFIYGLQPVSDDLATLQYRTKGGQKAPLIIRTRGHRLEGIWHAGSPIGLLLSSCRGVHLLVPRNMTQAAGFYNLLLQSDEPAIVIECLNGYRLKEKLPENVDQFTVPIGVPEILKEGEDITIVTYGSTIRIVKEAMNRLEDLNINCELIDVQSLMPFDVNHLILESIKKTNRVIFIDEDLPGAGTAYMMQKVMVEQNAYQWLDSAPRTLSAKDHRTAFGSDGDYYTKPNPQNTFEAIYEIMHESDPESYPMYYK